MKRRAECDDNKHKHAEHARCVALSANALMVRISGSELGVPAQPWVKQRADLARARCERAAVIIDEMLERKEKDNASETETDTENDVVTLGAASQLLAAAMNDCAIIEGASGIAHSRFCECPQYATAASSMTAATAARACTEELLPPSAIADSVEKLELMLTKDGVDVARLATALAGHHAILSGSKVLFALFTKHMTDVQAHPSAQRRCEIFENRDESEEARLRAAWVSKDYDVFVMARDAPAFLEKLKALFALPTLHASNGDEYIDVIPSIEGHGASVAISEYWSLSTGIEAIHRFGLFRKHRVPGRCHCACDHDKSKHAIKQCGFRNAQCSCGSNGTYDSLDCIATRYMEVIVLEDTLASSAAAACLRFDLSILQNFWDGGAHIKTFHPGCVVSKSSVFLPPQLLIETTPIESADKRPRTRARAAQRVQKYIDRGIDVFDPLCLGVGVGVDVDVDVSL